MKIKCYEMKYKIKIKCFFSIRHDIILCHLQTHERLRNQMTTSMNEQKPVVKKIQIKKYEKWWQSCWAKQNILKKSNENLWWWSTDINSFSALEGRWYFEFISFLNFKFYAKKEEEHLHSHAVNLIAGRRGCANNKF